MKFRWLWRESEAEMKFKETFIKILIPIVSILLAFVIGGILIACLGKNPIQAYGFLLNGAFGSAQKFAQTLTLSSPLIFTSLSAAVAYKCGVFNLGGEGQFIMGAIGSLYFCEKTGVTGLGGVLLSFLVGLAVGGIWGAIPGLLKILRGLNEMIVSIMLNYVALYLMGYVYTDLLREGSTPQTMQVDDSLKLMRFSTDFKVHWGVFLGIILAFVLAYVIYRTSFGFQLRAVGMNKVASRISGFPVKRLILYSFIISGAVAGLGGSVELHGKQYRLMSGFGSGFGFTGVAIALIAQLNPIGAMAVAIIFGIMQKGASSLQTGMKIPTSVVDIIQALVIIFAVAGTVLIRKPEIRQLFSKIGSGKGKEKEASA